MSDKPSYLGLLNAIAIAEARACAYLTAWAEVTPSADVRGVLLKVAAREGEHGMSFAKRINELGYQVRDKDDGDLASKMEIAQSACTDLEKMEAFGLHKLDTRDKPDLFDGFFRDHSIDIQTGELLGRYIAEERDSGRVLRACYESCAPRRAIATSWRPPSPTGWPASRRRSMPSASQYKTCAAWSPRRPS